MFDFFQIAGRVALNQRDRREYFVGAVGRRSDGALVTAYNGSPQFPVAEAHAECRLARKLDVGSVVWVARILKSGTFAMAKPCPNCERVLRSRGVRVIYFTIGPDDYDWLRFGK